MPVSIKEGRGQAVLGQMFGGEEVQVVGDAQILSESAKPKDDEKIDIKKEVMPEEVITLLRSMIPDFPDQISDLIGNMIEDWKEKEAHRMLLDRFGLPRSIASVETFKILWTNLDGAQKILRGKSMEVQGFVRRVEQTINQVLLMLAIELNRLESERKDNELAAKELETMPTEGQTMRTKISQSTPFFQEKSQELEVEHGKMTQSYNKFRAFVERLMGNLSSLSRIETPLDVAAPDPSQALPA